MTNEEVIRQLNDLKRMVDVKLVGWYLLAFFCGAMFGVMMVALMIKAKDHTVHVFKDPDGKISILTTQPDDLVVYHETGGDQNGGHRILDE